MSPSTQLSIRLTTEDRKRLDKAVSELKGPSMQTLCLHGIRIILDHIEGSNYAVSWPPTLQNLKKPDTVPPEWVTLVQRTVEETFSKLPKDKTPPHKGA